MSTPPKGLDDTARWPLSKVSPQEQEVHVSLRRARIAPRKVISHTQYFDVIATLLGQGLGIASFAEIILPPILRDTVILLHSLLNWRLI